MFAARECELDPRQLELRADECRILGAGDDRGKRAGDQPSSRLCVPFPDRDPCADRKGIGAPEGETRSRELIGRSEMYVSQANAERGVTACVELLAGTVQQ